MPVKQSKMHIGNLRLSCCVLIITIVMIAVHNGAVASYNTKATEMGISLIPIKRAITEIDAIILLNINNWNVV